jgi:regulator of cell morphogenesis and NO signaling
MSNAATAPASTDSSPDPSRSLSELVEENAQRARIFEAYNLDYCCGGSRSLSEACQSEGVDTDAIVEELEQADARAEETDADWETLSELVDLIVEQHHEYLREELKPLKDLVDKVAKVHGDNHPELEDLAEVYAELAREMPVHLSEEEQILFPAIRQLEDDESLDDQARETIDAVIDGLWDDHEETAGHLEKIVELTDGYTIPDDACPSYRTMLERLEDLEADTHMHVHRENNVLFDRVRQRLGGSAE